MPRPHSMVDGQATHPNFWSNPWFAKSCKRGRGKSQPAVDSPSSFKALVKLHGIGPLQSYMVLAMLAISIDGTTIIRLRMWNSWQVDQYFTDQNCSLYIAAPPTKFKFPALFKAETRRIGPVPEINVPDTTPDHHRKFRGPRARQLKLVRIATDRQTTTDYGTTEPLSQARRHCAPTWAGWT